MTDAKRVALGLAGLLALVVGIACDPDIPEITGDAFICNDNADCLKGYVCQDGMCVEPLPDIAPQCYDDDHDNFDTCAEPTPDCDDANPAVNPGATEVCNGIDDNCTGGIDESLTQDCAEQRGVCGGAVSTCAAGNWQPCDLDCPGPDCAYGASYVADEGNTDCDGQDNDCDGATDEGCCMPGTPCGLGCVALPASQCACAGTATCQSDGTLDQCLLDNGSPVKQPTFVPADELCGNGIDDNCNGTVDETGCTTP